MNAEALCSRLPPSTAEALSHLLVDEVDGIAIDVRAGLGSTARALGTRHATPSDLVRHLLSLDGYLGETAIVRLDLFDADISDSDATALASASWFGTVRALDLTGSRVKSTGLAAIARAARGLRAITLGSVPVGSAIGALDGLDGLTTLELSYAGMATDGLRVLADLSLPALEHLGLSGAHIHASLGALRRAARDGAALPAGEFRARDVAALLEGDLGRGLVSLNLSRVPMKATVAGKLAAAPLPRLARLDLSACTMTDAALGRALAAASWPALTELGLRRTWPRARGKKAAERALVDAAWRSTIERIDLGSNQLSAETLRTFVAGSPALRALRLKGNLLDADALSAVLASEAAPRLEVLVVSDNPVGSRACALLAAAPLTLQRLGLARLAVTDHDLATLCTAPWLSGLGLLDLTGNHLGDASVAAIARHLAHARLRLGRNGFTADGFARLTATFGDRVRGARFQVPRPPAPEVIGSALRLVPGPEDTPPAAGDPRVPKPVTRHDLGAHPCAGSREWFVGYAAEGRGHALVFLSRRGKKVILAPPVVVPPMNYAQKLCFAVDPELGWAAVVCSGVGSFAVDLATGAAQRLGDVGEMITGAAFVGSTLVVAHFDSVRCGQIEAWALTDGTWRHRDTLDDLPTRLRALEVGHEGRLIALGPTSFKGPVVFVGLRDGTLVRLGRTRGDAKLVAADDGPLIRTDALWSIAGVDDALP